MADGYNLEVEAKLDDKSYRDDLKKLVKWTSTQGKLLENSLNISAELDTVLYKGQLKKLQGDKIADKEVGIDGDTTKVNNKIKALQAKTKGKEIDLDADVDTTKAAAKTEAFVKAASAKQINIKTDVDNRSIQEIATSLTTATRAAEQLTGRLGTIGIVAGAAGIAVASIVTGLVGGVGIAAASTIEQTQVSLQALIGDSGKANALLKAFKTEADVSPFELKDYAITAAKFASATDDVVEIKKRTLQAANAAAQYGGDISLVGKALADVSNKGKLAGQEVIQFANAGIPIQGMVARFLMLNGTIDKMPLDKAIVQVGKLQEEGKITADVVRGAIDNALDPKIAEKFSKTLKGRLSTLKDAFKNAAASFVGVDISNFTGETIVNPGGFYDTLAKSVTNLSDTFNSAAFKKPLEEAGTKLGVAFAGLAEHLPFIISLLGQFVAVSASIVAEMVNLGAAFLTAFGPQIQQAMQYVNGHAETFAKIFGGLLAGGIFLKIGAALIGIVTPIFNLLPAIGAVVTGIGSIGGAITGIVTAFQGMALAAALTGTSVASVFIAAVAPVALVVTAIVAIGAALVSVYSSSSKLRGELVGGLKLIGTGFQLIFSAVKDIALGIYEIAKPIAEFLAPVINVLVASFGAVMVVVGGIAKVIGLIFRALSPIIGLVVKIALVFSPLGLLIAAIRWAWEKWGDDIKKVGKAIGDFFGKVVEFFKKSIDGIKNMVGGVEDFLSKIPVIGKYFKDAGDDGEKAMKKVKKSVEDTTPAFKDLGEKSKGFVDGIKSFLTDGLPPIDTSSLDAMKTSFDAQIEAMKTKSGDLQTIIDAGFIDLADYAIKTGGDTGAGLIKGWAEAIRAGKTPVLTEFRDLLEKQAKIAAEFEFMRKKYEKAFEAEFTNNLFKKAQGDSPAGLGRKSFDKEIKDLNKQGNLTYKEIGKQLDKKGSLLDDWNIKRGSTSAKALQKQLTDENNLYYKMNGLRLEAEKRQKEKDKKQAKVDKIMEELNKPVVDKTKSKKEMTPGEFGGGGPTVAAAGSTAGTSFLTGFANAFKGKDIFGGFKDSVSNKLIPLGAFISEKVLPLGGKAISGIKTGLSNALSTAGDIFDSVKSSISTGITSITNKFTTLRNNISGKAGEVFGAARGVGSSIWNGIFNGLSGAAGNIGDIAGRIWERIRAMLRGAINTVRNFRTPKLPIIGSFQPFLGFPGLASGTNNWQGGMARVGERGPENVILPQGSKVIPAHKSKEKSTSTTNNYYSTINGIGFDQAVAEWEAKLRAQRREVFV